MSSGMSNKERKELWYKTHGVRVDKIARARRRAKKLANRRQVEYRQ